MNGAERIKAVYRGEMVDRVERLAHQFLILIAV